MRQPDGRPEMALRRCARRAVPLLGGRQLSSTLTNPRRSVGRILKYGLVGTALGGAVVPALYYASLDDIGRRRFRVTYEGVGRFVRSVPITTYPDYQVTGMLDRTPRLGFRTK